MGTHGWAYRRRHLEATVLYEAVRDNLATLLAEASEVERGLPRYVERDFAKYLGTEVDVRPPSRKQPRCAFLKGFSLHTNMHLHANDRQGLERLCRYGARGALALECLSRAEGRPHRLSDEALAAGRRHAPPN